MRAVRTQAEDGMTDETKVASIKDVDAAMWEAFVENMDDARAGVREALAAARELDVLMPEEAAALKEEVTTANREWDGLLADYANLNDHCNALAERVRVLEEVEAAARIVASNMMVVRSTLGDPVLGPAYEVRGITVSPLQNALHRAALSPTEACPDGTR